VVGTPDSHDPKPVSWGDLPENVRHPLSSIPRELWGEVVVNFSQSDLLKDATELVAVFARVWDKSRAAEDFRDKPVTGDEREQFKKNFENALRLIAENIIQLGTRSRLIGELQRAQDLLSFRAPEEWQRKWTRKVARSASTGPEVRPPQPSPKKPSPNNKEQSERPSPQPRREAAKPPILIVPAVAQ
jgi:hypothetical protein